jgi:DNA-binding GntR family transcriptional regulator
MEPLAGSPVLVDLVYQRLLAAIIDCSLPPGRRIVQAELADQLGVSRAPVSHALMVLKHQGLLRESGRKGLEVAPIEPRRLRDLYHVRAALDGLAAGTAAERVAAGEMPAADLALLHDIYARGVALGDSDPIAQHVRADTEFHRGIAAISGNQAIDETLESAWPHLQRSMVFILESHARREEAWREHADILAAIEAGDPDSAARRAFDHAHKAGEYTETRLHEG